MSGGGGDRGEEDQLTSKEDVAFEFMIASRMGGLARPWDARHSARGEGLARYLTTTEGLRQAQSAGPPEADGPSTGSG